MDYPTLRQWTVGLDCEMTSFVLGASPIRLPSLHPGLRPDRMADGRPGYRKRPLDDGPFLGLKYHHCPTVFGWVIPRGRGLTRGEGGRR